MSIIKTIKFPGDTEAREIYDENARNLISQLSEEKVEIPTTAEVGQLIAVKAVDEYGKPTEWECVNETQGDWNQNDETAADYVRNRPFWTSDPVETEIVPEMSVTIEANAESTVSWYQSGQALTSDAIVAGANYTVYWNGNVYECVGINTDGTPYLGNSNIWWYDNGYEDNGLPFVIYSWEGRLGLGVWATSEDTDYTFRVVAHTSEVHKIDIKYLPDAVYTVPDEVVGKTVPCLPLPKLGVYTSTIDDVLDGATVEFTDALYMWQALLWAYTHEAPVTSCGIVGRVSSLNTLDDGNWRCHVDAYYFFTTTAEAFFSLQYRQLIFAFDNTTNTMSLSGNFTNHKLVCTT